MTLVSLDQQQPFVTKDGSRIRSLLDLTTAPVRNQSLAEATLEPGGTTTRHYHKLSEEFYYVTAGTGTMELDGEERQVKPGDAILIPPGAWHELRADGGVELRILCCCAPPYTHEDTYFE